jgi:secreted trypsin-like serine protease
MPKSTTMGLRCVLALGAALAVAAVCCAPAGAIVGGNKATAVDPPGGPLYYQVALIRNDRPTTSAGQFCGGSVRDDTDSPHPRHIVTAAHCVFDNSATAPGQPISPANLDVLAGTKLLDAGGKRLHVSAISIDPSYDPATLAHDSAVLTLADADPLHDTNAQPIEFVTADDWAAPSPSTIAVVSGWGQTASGSPYPDDLRWVAIPLATDGVCGASWAAEGGDTSVMVCAGQPGKDSCFGDSGGPLVVQIDQGIGVPRIPALAGIVSYGDLACDGDPPGVYTRVASSDISSYLTQVNPISAPRNTSPPAVGGAIAVGQTITCDAGGWDGDPTLEYQFARGLDQRTTAALTNLGSQTSYVVSSADVGSQLACIVKAHNGGGLAFSQSAWTAAVPAPPAPVQPVQPLNQSPSQTQQDIAAPVARITATRCTATRCTLTVAVTDAGFSAGIKTVQASVRSSYRSRCKRKGSRKTVPCTKHRTIRPSVAALTATHFKVVASKLPYGTQVFTLLAVDKAGHRQALPTTKTVKTKKPRKRR